MKLPCDFAAVIYHFPERPCVTCSVPGCSQSASYLSKTTSNVYVCKFHVSESLANEDGECAICLEPLRAKSIVDVPYRPFGCSHVFHVRCVEQWVSTGCGTCPMCRKTLTPRL